MLLLHPPHLASRCPGPQPPSPEALNPYFGQITCHLQVIAEACTLTRSALDAGFTVRFGGGSNGLSRAAISTGNSRSPTLGLPSNPSGRRSRPATAAPQPWVFPATRQGGDLDRQQPLPNPGSSHQGGDLAPPDCGLVFRDLDRARVGGEHTLYSSGGPRSIQERPQLSLRPAAGFIRPTACSLPDSFFPGRERVINAASGVIHGGRWQCGRR